MNGINNIDERMTRRALELAAAGAGRVSPSPLVGCVVLSSAGEVVGEGTYVHRDVTHAEVIALRGAGEAAKGGTAYVSLEPHSHHGRTPPCTEALIEAGIKRVVCPIEDPNPLVSGKGFDTLRAAGIAVETGILRKEAERQNEKFICWHRNRRPFVHLKAAVSIDGRIATRSGDSKWITSAASREIAQSLRYEYDSILVGAGTVEADDPSLTDRTAKPRDRALLRVVLDSGLRTGLDKQVVVTSEQHPSLFITSDEAGSAGDGFRRAGAEVVSAEGGPRNISSVLSVLYERGITSVLVEGGAEVAGSFLDARLVDKFTFFIAPLVIGGRNAPAAVAGEGPDKLSDAFRLTDTTIEKCGDDIVITGYPS